MSERHGKQRPEQRRDFSINDEMCIVTQMENKNMADDFKNQTARELLQCARMCLNVQQYTKR